MTWLYEACCKEPETLERREEVSAEVCWPVANLSAVSGSLRTLVSSGNRKRPSSLLDLRDSLQPGFKMPTPWRNLPDPLYLTP